MQAYLITNTITGLRYVGITKKTLAYRWRRHCEMRHNPEGSTCRALARAIAKHGTEAFTIEPLASARTSTDLMALERLLIAQWGTRAPAGYNLTAGGEGGFDPSPETRERLSQAQRGRIVSKETCRRISEAKTGFRHSAETKKKMSAERKTRPIPAGLTMKGKFGPESGMFGKKHTDETRAKMSASHSGKKQSEETRAKRSATLTGKQKSEAHRANLSAAKAGKMSPAQEEALQLMIEKNTGRKRGPVSDAARARITEAQRARRAREKLEASR